MSRRVSNKTRKSKEEQDLKLELLLEIRDMLKERDLRRTLESIQ